MNDTEQALANMRNIVPPGVTLDQTVTAGGSRGTDETKTIADRKRELALAQANEKVARVQDLPETSRARQEAELERDEIVATANIADGIPFPSPYPNTVPIPMPVPGWGTTTTLTPPKENATMDIFIIWAIVPDQPQAPWAVAVWDDESVAENEDGWLEALAKAEEEYGGRYVRVTKTSVNYDAVISAFEPVNI
ncbi:hypothetical protein SEA_PAULODIABOLI_65 [Microbacterium phage PauloDiaboli]|nr:hypothetical protein SEA_PAULODIABOLI_65 [Microbacterium phage PauloDiaboli]QWY83916.1 hypothetical protein SEA_A3WALLY_66 [Microbacterium phage A3Wally]